MNEQQASAYFERSVALLQEGKATDALKVLKKLDQEIPSNPGILYFTATALSMAGNKHKAIQTYERVIRLNPHFIEAYNNIALDLAYLGEHHKAISFIDQALAIRPDFIEAIDNKGCFLNAMGEYRAACHYFEMALHINPHDTTALANLSVAFMALGDYTKARTLAEALLQINPEDYRGYSNLGEVSLKLEDPNTALVHFLKVDSFKPDYPDNLAGLGATYRALGNLDQANSCFSKALKLNPDHVASHIGLGLMYHDMRDFPQALAHFNTNTQDKYRLSLREYCRALTQLHAGNLQAGWLDYGWRWKESDLPIPYLISARPLWAGQKTDEPVFIWHEQGVGDQILFGTLLTEAAQAAPQLIVRLDKRLIPLFERSFPAIRFISCDHQLTDNDFKYHLPVGDLARFHRHTLKDFDRQPTSYLYSDSNHAKQLRNKLENGKPIVGLAWVTKGKRSKERNLPIDSVVSIIQSVTPSELVDLQYSDTTEDRARISQNLGTDIRHLDEIDNFNDLDGLASLISACDFIITCSNSTAHFAGALGKETYLLVPFGRGRHWYWSHIGADGRSLWYPSVHVITQTIAGDWAEPMQALKDRLSSRPKLG